METLNYKNFFNNEYSSLDLSNLYYRNKAEFFKYIFSFYSPNNVENNFNILDEILNLKIFNLSSMFLYTHLKKELKKRKTYLLNKDFNYLFKMNLIFLANYFKIFHFSSLTFKKHKTIDYTKMDFMLKNTFKALTVKENDFHFSISTFNDKEINEKFSLIFDELILKNSKISLDKYNNYLTDCRKNLHTISYTNKVFFKESDIKTYTYEILENKKKFFLKGKKEIKKIEIFIDDITKEDFKFFMFSLSSIFFKKKYRLHIKNTFDEFKKIDKNKIYIYLCTDSNINKLWWTTENRYILSTTDLKNDLFFLFIKDLNENLLTLKKKDFKDLNEKEKNHYYNLSYYVSKRVNAFLKFLEEGGYGKYTHFC
ncbi:hypothetical protein [Sneathia sanguinegens]|uniref:hypothetical protein n=1 Tax=Sneathia sanguinegens TaxID=40543 RepID=UPI00290CF596|nr:hypothetical protein [Sneathia sanguinegens]MDU7497231.1 hypothetical protein [Sneathia sanguinegens]